MSWLNDWLAGEDSGAREAQIAAMEEEVASGIRSDPAVAAEVKARAADRVAAAEEGGEQLEEIRTSQGSLGYGAGDTDFSNLNPINWIQSTIQGFTNFGAAIGDALNLEGVGTADPGSIGETAAAAIAEGSKKVAIAIPKVGFPILLVGGAVGLVFLLVKF